MSNGEIFKVLVLIHHAEDLLDGPIFVKEFGNTQDIFSAFMVGRWGFQKVQESFLFGSICVVIEGLDPLSVVVGTVEDDDMDDEKIMVVVFGGQDQECFLLG